MRWSGAAAALVLAGTMLPSGYAGEEVKTITISAQEFVFSPNKLTLHVGQRVRVVFSNRGTVNHEFVSPILNAVKDVEVSSQGVTVEGDEIGEVNFAKGKVAALEMTPTKVGPFSSGARRRRQGDHTVTWACAAQSLLSNNVEGTARLTPTPVTPVSPWSGGKPS